MSTLILPPRYTPDSIALYSAAVEAGWNVERLQSWRVPSHLRFLNVALYGEPLFGAVVADQLSLVLLEPSFHWLTQIPKKYLLRKVLFTTLAEARKHSERAFIKPADDKCFQARIYDEGSMLPSSDVLSNNTPVLISEPVSWNIEFRFFILNGKIKTFSPYSRNGNSLQDENWKTSPAKTKKAQDFCLQAINELAASLPPSVVVDVGEIVDRGWAIVEANPSWASGIYGCEPSKILHVIARACLKKDEVSVEDKKWVVERVI